MYNYIYPVQYGWVNVIHQQLKLPSLFPLESFFSQVGEREGIASPNRHHRECIGGHHPPLGSRTTRIGLFLKCHFSPMNLIVAFPIMERQHTVYHACHCSLQVLKMTLHGINQLVHNRDPHDLILLTLQPRCVEPGLIINLSRIDSSSWEISKFEISNSTFFLIRTSMLTQFCQSKKIIDR